MKRRVPIKRVEAPKSPHCSGCLKTLAHLERYEAVYECSRVDCPRRKAVTAQPRS